ncbi:MAG: recombination mediator RecR [Verrucomicrobiota bacterium]|nr:recombination mediator RecR [Verrucomicrobiota bacterium]
MARYPRELVTLASYLRKLPGVGLRTSERFAFDLLYWQKEELTTLAQLLEKIQERLPPCTCCGSLTEGGVCLFCTDERRQSGQLCLVASARDPFAVESTGCYQGLYHVVEHLLSPLDGHHPESLGLDLIADRIARENIREMIIAFDSTLEGDTTALYIKQHFVSHDLRIVRLAFGLPVGSSLEAIDSGTLSRALSGRQSF